MSLPEQIRVEREALIDLLLTLDDEQWETPSLCEGWTVQDVAAHLAWAPVLAPVDLTLSAVRGRFNLNRINRDSARRWSARGRDAIVSQLRVNAARGAKPVGVPRIAALADAIVHGYDIRRPLGFAREVPPAAYAIVATWQAQLRPPLAWMVGGDARSTIAGLRLVADDLLWTYGEGPDVHGTAEAMLLVLTGRPVQSTELTGPGADQLWSRITTRR